MTKQRLSIATIVIGAVLLIPAASAGAAGCDPLDARQCLLPFPSNFNTVAQKGSDTGLRLNFSANQFPKNVNGVPGFPPELNRNDGFSPGSALLTYVPALDLAKSGAAPITDIAQYAQANAPIIVIDAATGKRQPIWAELDTNADAIFEPKSQMLMIHPAKNWLEGHRYIVALRNLKNSSGATIKPAAAFASLRNGKPIASVKSRRRSYDAIFKTLGKAKVTRSSLYLAWDFTIASQRNLSERALAMRNSTFSALGDKNLSDRKVAGKAPAFTVTKTTDYTQDQSTRIARQVEGTFTVPCFLSKNCVTGGTMSYKAAAKNHFTSIPRQQGTMQADFICRIPRSALTSPARPSLYGHGLLGKATEIAASNVDDMASEHNMMFCATPEIGMANDDIPNAIELLGNMSHFSSMPDRLQQGLLNGLVLGRLMIHPDGLPKNANYKNDAGASTINTANLYYDSNSQGAILGGALTALSPDFTRAVLGVPGMNYSLLLPRSIDFDTYELIFKPAYKSRLDRMILISAIQNLWDRGETNGYAQHVTTDPLPDTPKHQVLLHVALGDHQVAPVSAEVQARTIGIAGRRPVYDAGRSEDKTPLWNIPVLNYTSAGASGLVIWDSGPCRISGIFTACLETDVFNPLGGQGTPVAPTADVPPRLGRDPHSAPRATPAARQQKSDFLSPGGKITNVCPADRACRSAGWAY